MLILTTKGVRAFEVLQRPSQTAAAFSLERCLILEKIEMAMTASFQELISTSTFSVSGTTSRMRHHEIFRDNSNSHGAGGNR